MALLFESPYVEAALRIARWSIIVIGCVAFAPSVKAQQIFATPEQATEALVAALKSNERREILLSAGQRSTSCLRAMRSRMSWRATGWSSSSVREIES